MKLEGTRTLLTGASGGIGSETAKALAARGARLALLDRNPEALERLCAAIGAQGGEVFPVAVDLLDAGQRDAALDRAVAELGGVDLLVNCAGLQSFRPFAEEDPVLLERVLQVNTLAPIMVARRLLPGMIEAGGGRVVNIGSTFGSIGFAWFAAYSASKFGVRGFSEALRRELKGTGVGVTYVAPRAVKTRLNSDAVYRMAEEVKMNMDEPGWVAGRIVDAILRDRDEVYLGFPESLFVRVNALLPRLVDRALAGQNDRMLPFAKGENS